MKPALTAQNCVPELIRKLEKINDVQLYCRLLQDPTFLYKQVRVCSEVAQAYTKFASAHHEPSVGNREGLGHFLDDLPLNEHTNRPPTNRPPSARMSKEAVRGGTAGLHTGVALSQVDQPLSHDQPQQQRQPLLPKLDLGGRWSSKADMGRESQQQSQQLQRDSQRQIIDVQQHKNRLKAAREKAQQHTANRYGPVSAKPHKPQPNTLAFSLFTDWKKECKSDDQRLETLKQRVAEQGALTDRVRPARAGEAAAPGQPLSARPPNNVRSSIVGRPARQFSMAAAAIDPALANELAYHQGQAAMQKQFLQDMIRDTKLRLNLGTAEGSSQTVADTYQDSGMQIQPFGSLNQQGGDDVFDQVAAQDSSVSQDCSVSHSASTVPVPLSAQDKLDQLQHEAEQEQEQGIQSAHVLDGGHTSPQHEQLSHPDDGSWNADSEMEYEEEKDREQDHQDMLQHGRAAQAPRLDLGRLRAPDHDQHADKASASESSGFIQSEISSARVDDMADEMLLAALHMATDQDPEKHRHALRGILPELESDEQNYFLNVITDLKGYNDDAALDAIF